MRAICVQRVFLIKLCICIDIHIDPHYTEGTKTKNYCHSTINKSKRDVAGKYGALGSDCDSPIALVDATFDYLKNNVNDIDFIVYTGDTVRHVNIHFLLPFKCNYIN